MTSTTSFESRFLAVRETHNARVRLFCFPSAGSGISILHSWFKGLPPDIQVCPIQLPGRENRRLETAFTRISSLVPVLADVVQSHINGAFAFFGHSLGSLIAFQLTRELRRRGQPVPSRLIVSARKSPHIPIDDEPVHHLPQPELVAWLRTRFNGIPETILADPELMDIFIPVLRADLEMIATYVHTDEEPLSCPISAYGGLDDRAVRREGVAAWAAQTSAAFTLRMFPGDHFFPKTAPAAFLRAITEDLETL